MLNSAAMFDVATALGPWHVSHVFSSTFFSIRAAVAPLCGLWQLSQPLSATVV